MMAWEGRAERREGEGRKKGVREVTQERCLWEEGSEKNYCGSLTIWQVMKHFVMQNGKKKEGKKCGKVMRL